MHPLRGRPAAWAEAGTAGGRVGAPAHRRPGPWPQGACIGIPWYDASGERLREWMGLSADRFYDASAVAIVPMGFCYPGRAGSGDLPPRPECARMWHARLNAQLPRVGLTLLIGSHAHRHYLGARRGDSLAATVRAWADHLPHGQLPLPHPSPRNQPWMVKHPWFAHEVLPALREAVRNVLS